MPFHIAQLDGSNNAVQLYDANGNPIAVQDGAVLPSTKTGLFILGSDGTNVRLVNVDSNGAVRLQSSGALGSAIPTRALLLGGSDYAGSPLLRALNVDSTGKIGLQSAGVDGAAVPGKALQVGGKDTSGNLQSIAVDTSGRIITAPAAAAATSAGFRNGYVATAAVTQVPVNATAYTEQTTAGVVRSLKSANAADTNTTGTGAWQVKITYYDTTLAGPFTETVNLAGTAAVNTVNTNICFIEKMEVVAAGSGNQNVGIISLFTAAAGGGVAFASIAVGDNSTNYSHHYVPSGKTLYITSITVGAKGNISALLFGRQTNPLVASSPEQTITDRLRVGNNITLSRNYGTPLQVVGPARFRMVVTPDANTASTWYAGWDFYEG